MRLRVVDMCAGDGAGHDGKYDSSPSIIKKHLTSDHPSSRKLHDKLAYLYEIQTDTFSRLSGRFGGTPGITIERRDSSTWTLAEIDLKPRDCVFIYADPNSIATLPVTPGLVGSLTPETLFLMTLGCNASGCKRQPKQERDGWHSTALMVAESIQPRHDLLLIWLNRDSHQWAYLMSTPLAWSDDVLRGSIRKGNQLWPNGVDGLSMKTHGKNLMKAKFADLFYTKEENAK